MAARCTHSAACRCCQLFATSSVVPLLRVGSMAHYIAAVSIRRRLAGFCRPVVTPWDRPFFGGRLREQITPTHALGLSKIFFAKFTPRRGVRCSKTGLRQGALRFGPVFCAMLSASAGRQPTGETIAGGGQHAGGQRRHERG